MLALLGGCRLCTAVSDSRGQYGVVFKLVLVSLFPFFPFPFPLASPLLPVGAEKATLISFASSTSQFPSPSVVLRLGSSFVSITGSIFYIRDLLACTSSVPGIWLSLIHFLLICLAFRLPMRSTPNLLALLASTSLPYSTLAPAPVNSLPSCSVLYEGTTTTYQRAINRASNHTRQGKPHPSFHADAFSAPPCLVHVLRLATPCTRSSAPSIRLASSQPPDCSSLE